MRGDQSPTEKLRVRLTMNTVPVQSPPAKV
jgi:hypothetical protein